MKFIGIFSLLVSMNVFAQIAPSPLKHSIDPTCQFQVSKAIIEDATNKYGGQYTVLTSGLHVDIYAVLESYPGSHLSKAVLTLKRKSTGAKSEIYYDAMSGSVGLGSNGHPIHRCSLEIKQITRQEYETIEE